MEKTPLIKYNTSSVGVIKLIGEFAGVIKIDVTNAGAFCETCVERRCPIAIADNAIPVELAIKSALMCTNTIPGGNCCVVHRRKFYCVTRNMIILKTLEDGKAKIN